MPRNPSIKWRRIDEQELNRSIKNFNQKLDRIAKKNSNATEYLPNRLKKKDIKLDVQTRQDYNYFLESIHKFSERGSEELYESAKGIKITAWEKADIERKVDIINRNRRREKQRLNKIKLTVLGEQTHMSVGLMQSITTNSLNPKIFNIDKIKKGEEWEKFVESVEKQTKATYHDDRAWRYLENYMKGLHNVFGSSADDIIKLIEKIDENKFYDLARQEAFGKISFYYFEPISLEDKLELLSSYWMEVLK